MSSTDKQSELEEWFRPLLSISNQSLISLAWDIRRKSSRDCFATAKVINRLSGSYNLVYIVEFDNGLKYVIRVLATGWGG